MDTVDVVDMEDSGHVLQPVEAMSGLLLACSRRSDFGACLVPLLVALGYRGDWRHVAEVLPFGDDPLDLTGLRNTLARLSFTSHLERCSLTHIDPRRLPCLFLSHKHEVMVALGDQSGTMVVFHAKTATHATFVDDKKGIACFFEPVDEEERSVHQAHVGWFSMVTERFRRLIGHVLLMTLIITLLQIVFPLFVMTVYDRVLGRGTIHLSGVFTTLTHLLIGVGVALLFDWLFRKIRASMAIYLGAQLDGIVGGATFLRILSLSATFTERSPIGAQVARLKEFDSVRAFFTTPLAMVFFDLPFSLLLLVVIAFFGGFLVFVPLLAMGLFVLLWMGLQPLVAREEVRSRLAGSRKQAFAMESLSKMRAIRYCGAEKVWLERFRALSAQFAQANQRTERINAIVQTIAHFLVVSAGVITIGGGVFQVLAGEMSSGALIALMILVWKALSPVQSAFLAATRLQQLRASIGQINTLMHVAPEWEASVVPPTSKGLNLASKGEISFSGVGLRYLPEAEPALAGVSFEVRAGETVAIVGPNGSGKSSLLKILLGLYVPQMGSILVDGLDIRRMHPLTLRRSMVYVPQSGTLYHGSITQNLRLAHPLASEEALHRACRHAQVYDAVTALPQGFETWVGGRERIPLPTGLVQKISLARAYLKLEAISTSLHTGGILLFDEPTNSLDRNTDLAFMEKIRYLRGHCTCTILIATHRPSHMRLADRIFYLDRGVLRLAGPTAEVLPQILKDPV